MTTKEVAEALGVDASTVTRAAEKCGLACQNGVVREWNEDEVTAISTRIHNNEKLGRKSSGETDLCNIEKVLTVKEKCCTQQELKTTFNRVAAQMDLETRYRAAMALNMSVLAELEGDVRILKEENNTLRLEADLRDDWLTVFKMQELDEGLHDTNGCAVGRRLAMMARHMAVVNKVALDSLMKNIKSENTKYPTVHTYHISVWRAVYPNARYPGDDK